MAEESIDSLLTPEKNELDSVRVGKKSPEYSDSLNDGDCTDYHRHRASSGIHHLGDNSNRNSNEKLESANTTKVPHYLKTSTGSCHDFCKYGRKHGFEEKTTTTLRIRIAKMSLTNQKGVTKMNSPGVKPFLDMEFDSPKPKASLDPIPVSSRENASGKKILLTKHKSLPSKKTSSPDPSEVIKRKISLPGRNIEVPIKHGSLSDGEMSKTEKKVGCLTKKHLSAGMQLKPAMDKMKSLSDSSNGTIRKMRRNSDVTPVKRVTEIKTSAQKAMVPLSSNSLSKIPSSKTTSTHSRKARNSVPLPNDENKIYRTDAKKSVNEKVSGKSLCAIMTKSNAKEPSLSSHIKDVDGVTRKFVPDKNKRVNTSKAHPESQNDNKILRKSRLIVSEDKYRSPVKLRFKSGKVVDIQSDNNSPRRLKFSWARINTTNVGNSSVKVILKHRDVQGKKDGQGLFNNVIEETASKLVESRKSKVKALVGAFETVISLQDTKPSSHTVKSSGD